MGIKRPICNICGGLGYIVESEATEVSLEITRPCNCSVEHNRLVVRDLQSQITQLKAENDKLNNTKLEGNCTCSLKQALIDSLKAENERLKCCLKSTYEHDLPKIDEMCDMVGFHRFTMLRSELEELLEIPTEPINK